MKIFFLGPLDSTFVKNDIYILSKNNVLLKENSSIGRGFSGLFNLIAITFRSIFKTIIADAVYCWFADWTTLIPTMLGKLLKKRVYVVAGGFDVCYVPEMAYGAKARKVRWFCVRNTFKHCYHILPVSKYALRMLDKQTDMQHAPASVVYNAVWTDELILLKPEKIERNIILTVSGTDSKKEFYIKGLDKFILVAAQLPHRQFVIAGLIGEALDLAKEKSQYYDNVKLIPGPLSFKEELVPLYYQSVAYLQLSIDETFGMAVVESMACGSMTIVSQNGALPELVQDKNYILQFDKDIPFLIEKNFSMYESERNIFVEKAKKFDISLREQKLLSIVH